MRIVMTTTVAAPRFGPGTIVAEALEMHPKARWVFAAYHLSGCSSCGMAYEETLEEMAGCYGIPLEQFLTDLNSLDDPLLVRRYDRPRS
jgi:hypothetical protein